MAPPYLVMTDTIDTVTFADGAGGPSDFKLQHPSWAPKVAELRDELLAQRGPYHDVVEEMDVLVSGSTPAAALANLNKLRRLLDKADRWSRGDHDSILPVVLKFSPRDATVSSAVSPMQTIVLGRAPGDNTSQFVLPTTIGDLSTTLLYVFDIRLRFRRRGLWLHTTQADVVLSITNGSPQIFDFGSTLIALAPTQIQISNVGTGRSTGNWFHGGFLLVGDETEGVQPLVQYSAESAVPATGYAATADAARNAHSGNVLTYTAPSTGEHFSGSLGPWATVPASCRMVTVLANIKPSATASFGVRVRVDSELHNQFTAMAPIAAAPALGVYPRWVNLGLVPVSGAIANTYLAITSSAVGGVLQIDSVVLLDTQAVQVFSIVGHGDNEGSTTTLQGTLNVDHALGTLRQPRVRVSNRPVAYAGDAVIMTKERFVYTDLLVSGGGAAAAGDRWVQTDITGVNAPLNNDWTLTRTRAYLVAE